MYINGIPKTEKIWLKYETEKGNIYYMTSKETRDYYFLYKIENNKAVKMAKSKSPIDLEKSILLT